MQENANGQAANIIVPDNIKQMGGLENELRIYMEDYVYTYLCQYAKTGGGKEKLGVLMGRHIISGSQSTIIISGFIQGKHSLPERGSETLTKDSWNYINESRDKYFKGLEIVGWVHTQPGFGGFLMSRDEAYHNEFFPQDHQVLYILDPTERIDTFYIRNKESGRLRSAGGYFIYYDTNEAMQDYMIDNRLVKAKEPPLYPNTEKTEKPKKTGLFGTLKKAQEPLTTSQDPAVQGREKLKKRSAGELQKHRIAILGGVSAILCASCIMICLNVMNHGERIRNLEAEVNSSGILTSNDTATVFASQDEEGKASVSENEYELNISSSIHAEEHGTAPSEPAKEEVPKEANSAVTETAAAIPEYYIVEKGDSLSYISRKFYGNDSMIPKIMEENGIENSDKIYYGKKIKLPTQ